MIERILIPLDGSQRAEAPLSQAARLLRLSGAEVCLLRTYGIPLIGTEESISQLREEAIRYLEAMRDRLAPLGVEVRPFVREGVPAEVILDVAEKERVSLIVMSSHGRTGIPRWVFGGVAEKVLRATDVPLLILRSFVPDEGGRMFPSAPGELQPKRILVPIDASALSLEVVRPVADLARLFDAKVLLLNVVEEGPVCRPRIPQLKRAHDVLTEARINLECMERRGDAAYEILDACREYSADMIAMSTHGRSGVTRWVLGSVTEKVLQAATVPMLVVRARRLGERQS